MLGVNMLWQDIKWGEYEKFIYTIFFIICPTNVLGVMLYYMLHGVKNRPGKGRLILKIILVAVFMGILGFGGAKLALHVVSSAYVILIACLIEMAVTRMNKGDNILRDEKGDCLDSAFFDYAFIPDKTVSFPLDIENYRHDRRYGYLQDIGLVMKGKYKAKIGALVLAKNNRYLCPLDQIIINGTTDNMLASRGDEIIIKTISRGDNTSDIAVIGSEGREL
jgi:hypothetical protein